MTCLFHNNDTDKHDGELYNVKHRRQGLYRFPTLRSHPTTPELSYTKDIAEVFVPLNRYCSNLFQLNPFSFPPISGVLVPFGTLSFTNPTFAFKAERSGSGLKEFSSETLRGLLNPREIVRGVLWTLISREERIPVPANPLFTEVDVFSSL